MSKKSSDEGRRLNELRRSNASGIHLDKRQKRNRDRSTRERNARQEAIEASQRELDEITKNYQYIYEFLWHITEEGPVTLGQVRSVLSFELNMSRDEVMGYVMYLISMEKFQINPHFQIERK